MTDFEIRPRNNRSKSQRSLVCGVGLNDANYITIYKNANGKKIECPYYKRWLNMIHRCYSDAFPSYKGCYVCKEWLAFSSFRRWMVDQDWNNKDLDKDLLMPGNKIYAPDRCMFVPHDINTLLNNCKSSRGDLPQGVVWEEAAKRFRVQCSVPWKSSRYVGVTRDLSEAVQMYRNYKSSLIREKADAFGGRLKDCLIVHAHRISKGEIN